MYTFISRVMSFIFLFESKKKIRVKPFLTALLERSHVPFEVCTHLHYKFNIKKKKKKTTTTTKTALINNWC